MEITKETLNDSKRITGLVEIQLLQRDSRTQQGSERNKTKNILELHRLCVSNRKLNLHFMQTTSLPSIKLVAVRDIVICLSMLKTICIFMRGKDVIHINQACETSSRNSAA